MPAITDGPSPKYIYEINTDKTKNKIATIYKIIDNFVLSDILCVT